jgi:hypothetical protein
MRKDRIAAAEEGATAAPSGRRSRAESVTKGPKDLGPGDQGAGADPPSLDI